LETSVCKTPPILFTPQFLHREIGIPKKVGNIAIIKCIAIINKTNMGGGLLQLVAYGAQDLYITGNPQITFFKSIYRRHSNFSMENIECLFNGKVGFGQRVVCSLPRNGDLVHKMYLKMTVSKLTQNPIAIHSYRDFLAYRLVEYVSVEIGGQEIDKQYREWMFIWNELTTPSGQKEGLYQMILAGGHQYQSFPPVRGNTNDETLYLPLNFWFNSNPGLALPLISLQYHEVKIIVKFTENTSFIYSLQNSSYNLLSPNTAFPEPSFNATLLVDYIFLDTEERRRFAQLSHEYLIEQVQYNGYDVIDTNTQKSYNIPLRFNHPVKELIWLVTSDNDDWINISEDNDYESFLDEDNVHVLKKVKLSLNGHDRFAERDAKYFESVQSYQHHTNSPFFTRVKPTYLNQLYIRYNYGCYSFALQPEEHQPSGTLNFSRIDSAILNVVSNPIQYDKYKLHIFGRSYNVLRITAGMGGLLYSN
jgi:hypothetical protein